MTWRRKKKAKPDPMGLRLTQTGLNGNTARVEWGGRDISACIQRVEIDVSCDDVTRVTIHAIAADQVTDVVAGEINVIERAYQVHRPNTSLQETPVRKLLSELEVEA